MNIDAIEKIREKEKLQNQKITELKRRMKKLRQRLLFSGKDVYENYGQKELGKFEDKIKKTFIAYDINEYTNEKAKELMKDFMKFQNEVWNYTGN